MPVLLNRLLLLVLFAIAGFMAWEFQQKLYANKGRLVVTQSNVVPGAVEFLWSSEVELPMARRFYEAFQEWKGKTKHIVIRLNSPGGSLGEGRDVIAVIEEMKKTHRVDTYVGALENCLSMCVPIYLHGQRRLAHAKSRWMFHEPRSVDFFTDEAVKEPEFERKRMVKNYVQKYFVNSPIRKQWLDQLLKQWQGKDIWLTGQQLVDTNSNVITELR